MDPTYFGPHTMIFPLFTAAYICPLSRFFQSHHPRFHERLEDDFPNVASLGIIRLTASSYRDGDYGNSTGIARLARGTARKHVTDRRHLVSGGRIHSR